jgi:hypothetical protein
VNFEQLLTQQNKTKKARRGVAAGMNTTASTTTKVPTKKPKTNVGFFYVAVSSHP